VPAVASAEVKSSQATETAAEVSDSDFEARVAAAMAAYSHTNESETTQAQTVEEAPSAPETHAVSAKHAAAAEIPSFEYQPAAGHVETTRAEVAHEEPVAQVEAPAASTEHAAVAASIEAATPEAAAAAAADSGALTPERANPARPGGPDADHHTIANAI